MEESRTSYSDSTKILRASLPLPPLPHPSKAINNDPYLNFVFVLNCMQFLSISYFHSLCAVSGASDYNPEQSRKATIKQRPKHSFISFTHQRNEIVIFFYSEMN